MAWTGHGGPGREQVYQVKRHEHLTTVATTAAQLLEQYGCSLSAEQARDAELTALRHAGYVHRHQGEFQVGPLNRNLANARLASSSRCFPPPSPTTSAQGSSESSCCPTSSRHIITWPVTALTQDPPGTTGLRLTKAYDRLVNANTCDPGMGCGPKLYYGRGEGRAWVTGGRCEERWIERGGRLYPGIVGGKQHDGALCAR